MKSGDALEVYSIVKYLKTNQKNSIHLAGGTHVDMLQNECEKYFDKIVVGLVKNVFLRQLLIKILKKIHWKL